MKKLSLEMLRLTSDEVLHRSQMKKITGGYGNCYLTCDDWTRSMQVNDCSTSSRELYCGTTSATCNC